MIDLHHYILIWACIIGLCFGSFYNVVILRTLSKESIVFPPSKCPKCGNKLLAWHNIPVFSYILLRGKCHFCKEKISIQYPIIELVTMILFATTYLKFGLTIKSLFVLFWVSCLIIMTGTDIREKLVDCNLAVAMAISGIVYSFWFGGLETGLYSIGGLVVGIIILELIARSGFFIAGTRAMGEADTYVAAALGAIFGKSILAVLFASLVSSMLFILPVFFYNQFKANNKGICIMSVLFTLSVLVFQLKWQNLYMLALILIVGVGLIYFILRDIRKVEARNYLPYVPALSLGALYFLFFVI